MRTVKIYKDDYDKLVELAKKYGSTPQKVLIKLVRNYLKSKAA